MTPELQHKINSIIYANPQADDKEVLYQLKQLIYETDKTTIEEVLPFTEHIKESFLTIQKRANRADIFEATFGFPQLDEITNGFNFGEFVVVGARPAMGKTAFLLSLVNHISQTYPVLYITLDLSASQLTERLIVSVVEIRGESIRSGRLEDDEWERLDKNGKKLFERQLFIQDKSNTSIDAIRTLCEQQIKENGVKVIFVDYIQLISAYRKRQYREQEVSYISRELKNIAKLFNVCVIASSQLNRGIENRQGMWGKRPQLSDLRDSGAIEQDADKVLFVHRPEYYGLTEDEMGNSLVGVAEIIVAKNRNGAVGISLLRFDNEYIRFRNLNDRSVVSVAKSHCNFAGKDEFSFTPNRYMEVSQNKELETSEPLNKLIDELDLEKPPF